MQHHDLDRSIPGFRPPVATVTLASFAGLVAGAGALGAASSGRPRRQLWYAMLRKPPFQPPAWVFGPVWSALYGTIAYAGYRVFNAPPSRTRSAALGLWGAQLLLNTAWSYLFFKRRAPKAALADSALMLATIAGFVWMARTVDRRAAWLFVPYLGWVTFATLLNEEIVRRNA